MAQGCKLFARFRGSCECKCCGLFGKVYFFDRHTAGRGPSLAFGVRLVRALITTIFVAALAGFPACRFWPGSVPFGRPLALLWPRTLRGPTVPDAPRPALRPQNCIDLHPETETEKLVTVLRKETVDGRAEEGTGI